MEKLTDVIKGEKPLKWTDDQVSKMRSTFGIVVIIIATFSLAAGIEVLNGVNNFITNLGFWISYLMTLFLGLYARNNMKQRGLFLGRKDPNYQTVLKSIESRYKELIDEGIEEEFDIECWIENNKRKLTAYRSHLIDEIQFAKESNKERLIVHLDCCDKYEIALKNKDVAAIKSLERDHYFRLENIKVKYAPVTKGILFHGVSYKKEWQNDDLRMNTNSIFWTKSAHSMVPIIFLTLVLQLVISSFQSEVLTLSILGKVLLDLANKTISVITGSISGHSIGQEVAKVNEVVKLQSRNAMIEKLLKRSVNPNV